MTTTVPSTVSVDSLYKTYESDSGDVQVLEGLSFDIADGQFVSVVGPSGCGKSTLLRIVAGLTSRTAGRVAVGEREVNGPIKGCGFVFQSPVLMEWRTVRKNVLLPLEVLHRKDADSVARVDHLLAMAGLDEFADRMPHELSGGMQQRVAICRALVTDPPLLLMDEPFGALDALTREEMGNALLDIWRATRKTVIFVTHSIDEAVYLSDHVYVMGRRPSTIRATVDIDLPRPRNARTRLSPPFIEYCDTIRNAINVA